MTLNEPAMEEIPTPTGPMRVYRFTPSGGVPRPAVILYSEIFQVTGPIRRLAARLAGEGFEVLVPEIYHEYEPAGSVLAYDDAGSKRGNFLKLEKPLAAYDGDARALIDWVLARPYPWRGIGAIGFCLGGRLAFRAALDKRVAAAACFYGTDLHLVRDDGKGDDALARAGEIEGELLMIWGRQDPHVPLEGRRKIHDALAAADRNFQWHEFNGAHAFARDEGLRYDAAVSRLAWELALELFKRRLMIPRI